MIDYLPVIELRLLQLVDGIEAAISLLPTEQARSAKRCELVVSIGVQKGPPIGVQKGPPSSSSVTGM
ncbi:hypothetical protein ACH0BU_17810, partial [Sphingomonas olei]